MNQQHTMHTAFVRYKGPTEKRPARIIVEISTISTKKIVESKLFTATEYDQVNNIINHISEGKLRVLHALSLPEKLTRKYRSAYLLCEV